MPHRLSRQSHLKISLLVISGTCISLWVSEMVNETSSPMFTTKKALKRCPCSVIRQHEELLVSSLVLGDPERNTSIGSQTRCALLNLGKCLAQVLGDGVSAETALRDHVANVSVYMPNLSKGAFQEMNEAYLSFFPGAIPPSRITVGGLPFAANTNALVGFDCFAVVDPSKMYRFVEPSIGRIPAFCSSTVVCVENRFIIFLSGTLGTLPGSIDLVDTRDISKQAIMTLDNMVTIARSTVSSILERAKATDSEESCSYEMFGNIKDVSSAYLRTLSKYVYLSSCSPALDSQKSSTFSHQYIATVGGGRPVELKCRGKDTERPKLWVVPPLNDNGPGPGLMFDGTQLAMGALVEMKCILEASFRNDGLHWQKHDSFGFAEIYQKVEDHDSLISWVGGLGFTTTIWCSVPEEDVSNQPVLNLLAHKGASSILTLLRKDSRSESSISVLRAELYLSAQRDCTWDVRGVLQGLAKIDELQDLPISVFHVGSVCAEHPFAFGVQLVVAAQ